MSTISGTPQNDDLRGTPGNDIILAMAGNDRLDDGDGALQFDAQEKRYYVAGDDRLEGGPGNDELISNVTAGPDHDRLYGGAGHDTFVYSLGSDLNVDLYGVDVRASGQDAIMDFQQGTDRIDVRSSYDREPLTDPYAHTGNFGLFDSNHDGALSNADDLVHVTDVRIDGVGELSTILDMPSVYSHGIVPGTVDRLIVYGVDHLTQADFVPDQDLPYILQGTDGNDHIAGNLLDNTVYGGAGNDAIDGGGGGDYILAGAGNDHVDGGAGNDTIYDNGGSGIGPIVDDDVIHGGDGNDTLVMGASAGDRDRVFGDAGNDRFLFRLDAADPHGTGQDVVMDFAKGQDKLAFEVQGAGSSGEQGTFAMFDSNHDGVLDNGDAHVRVQSITIDGVAKASTVLQIADVLLGPEAHVPAADQTVIVWGQTGLTASDVSSTSSGASQVASAAGGSINSLVTTATHQDAIA